jgi:hypothetical protein
MKTSVTIIYEAGYKERRSYTGSPNQIAYYLRGKKKDGAVYFYYGTSRIYL